jgi:hypothetical protein
MKKLVSLLALAATLAAGSAAHADSVVVFNPKTGRVGVATATAPGVAWDRLKGRALSDLGVRTDAGLEVYRVVSRHGHLSIATGRPRATSPFVASGNAGNGTNLLPRATEEISSRLALTHLRLRLTGRSNLPAFNERVKSWFDLGFAAR